MEDDDQPGQPGSPTLKRPIQVTGGPGEEDEAEQPRQREELIKSDEHSGWCYCHLIHEFP